MIAEKVLLTTALAASIAQAPHPTRHPVAITADNILQLAPPMPASLKNDMERFFDRHPKLLALLSGASYYQPLSKMRHAPFSMNLRRMSWKDKRFKAHMKRALAGIHHKILKKHYDVLYNNLIIDVDGYWVMKTSSFYNRRENIYHELQLAHNTKKLSRSKLKEFVKNRGGHTYQTISRMAGWLRAKQAQEELHEEMHLDCIYLPKKYLMHIPGRPTAVDDTNYVIVAEKVSGLVPIFETNLLSDPNVVAQLAHIILRSSLWDIHRDNVLAKDGKACLIDFEQANGRRPSDFGKEHQTLGDVHKLQGLIKEYAQKTNRDLSAIEKLVSDIALSYRA